MYLNLPTFFDITLDGYYVLLLTIFHFTQLFVIQNVKMVVTVVLQILAPVQWVGQATHVRRVSNTDFIMYISIAWQGHWGDQKNKNLENLI